jgi:hypothetical protein
VWRYLYDICSIVLDKIYPAKGVVGIDGGVVHAAHTGSAKHKVKFKFPKTRNHYGCHESNRHRNDEHVLDGRLRPLSVFFEKHMRSRLP